MSTTTYDNNGAIYQAELHYWPVESEVDFLGVPNNRKFRVRVRPRGNPSPAVQGTVTLKVTLPSPPAGWLEVPVTHVTVHTPTPWDSDTRKTLGILWGGEHPYHTDWLEISLSGDPPVSNEAESEYIFEVSMTNEKQVQGEVEY